MKMTDERTVKPSAIPSIYELERKLKSIGLTERNIITLIQDETSPKMSKRDIVNALKAAKKIEKQIKDYKIPFHHPD